jgi:hypothetical protein
VGRLVHVVEGSTSRSADVDTHADLPKHAFGSCPVCTRRLRAQEQARPAERHHGPRRTVPTRFLVQTSAVPAKDATA